MESEDNLVVNLNESSVLDSKIECIKNVNKYLRKALRKIDDLVKESETREEQEDSNGNQSELGENKLNGFEHKSINEAACNVPMTRSEVESCEENDVTVELSSDDNEDLLVDDPELYKTVFVKPTTIRSKIEVTNGSTVLHEWYKAFITNLPVSTDEFRLIHWINSKGQPDPDDLVMSNKRTFKTCIVSYSNKAKRDRLLNLDGNLYDDVNISIKTFVSDHSPEVDRIQVGPEIVRPTKKLKNSKRNKH